MRARRRIAARAAQHFTLVYAPHGRGVERVYRKGTAACLLLTVPLYLAAVPLTASLLLAYTRHSSCGLTSAAMSSCLKWKKLKRAMPFLPTSNTSSIVHVNVAGMGLDMVACTGWCLALTARLKTWRLSSLALSRKTSSGNLSHTCATHAGSILRHHARAAAWRLGAAFYPLNWPGIALHCTTFDTTVQRGGIARDNLTHHQEFTSQVCVLPDWRNWVTKASRASPLLILSM